MLSLGPLHQSAVISVAIRKLDFIAYFIYQAPTAKERQYKTYYDIMCVSLYMVYVADLLMNIDTLHLLVCAVHSH